MAINRLKAKKTKKTSATTNSRYIGAFVVAVKIYSNEEAYVGRGYSGIVGSVEPIELRLLTEGQIAYLDGVLFWET